MWWSTAGAQEDVLSLGVKSKNEVAEAMVDVSVALFQKVRVWVYGDVGAVGILRGAGKQEIVVISRCCCTRLAAVAMHGALTLAARIMSCESPPKTQISKLFLTKVLSDRKSARIGRMCCFWAKSVFTAYQI